jgi:hypothetical protein
MTTHQLKSRWEYFSRIWSGQNAAEFRKNDRGFAVDDILELREWDPVTEEYTGRSLRRRVTLVTPLGPLGAPGYVLMEIRPEAEE